LFEVWHEVSPTKVVWYEREGGVRYRNSGVLPFSAAEAAGMVGKDGLVADDSVCAGSDGRQSAV
jgi:hypothetical protein